MKQTIITLISVLSVAILAGGCTKNDADFDNKVYIDADRRVATLWIKKTIPVYEQTLYAEAARPATHEIGVKYKADPTLVDTYNRFYEDKAVILPAEHYELSTDRVTIGVGRVRSTPLAIRFKQINELDNQIVYVLPVTVEQADIEVLTKARTMYYVFKGAALINTVADIERNYLSVDWKKPEVCNSLTKMTIEVLVRVREYDKQLSTILGIENRFLIRLGDVDRERNQLQVVYGKETKDKFPTPDARKGLPTNKWQHIAVTFTAETKEMIIYVNGKQQSKGIVSLNSVNLGTGGDEGFHIGRSFDDSRFLTGDIAECRIWNIVRTPEEIAANPYEVDPSTPGLVAYWRFNEGQGTAVKDHTLNGNDATANMLLKWTPVTLPEPKK